MTAPTPPPDFPACADPLDTLVKLSRFYGSDPRFVVAGGGNTSYKTDTRLFVKASGSALGSITRDGFAELDRRQLDALAAADLGTNAQQREERFKQAALAARIHPEKGQRPSVETLLHHLCPGRFVVHTHATIANTLTCCTRERELADQWFGDDVLWLPYVDPGFVLGQEFRRGIHAYQARTGRQMPTAVLMGNHGLIVSGDKPAAIGQRTTDVLGVISQRLGDAWNEAGFGAVSASVGGAESAAVVEAIRRVLAEPGAGHAANAKAMAVVFDNSALSLSLANGVRGRAAATAGPLNPDQIVYCTSYALWFEVSAGEPPAAAVERLRQALTAHQARTGAAPKVVIAGGAGIFFRGDDGPGAQTVRSMYLDAVQVMAGAARLGGVNYLNAAQRGFIEQWEAEAFRRQVAAKTGKPA